MFLSVFPTSISQKVEQYWCQIIYCVIYLRVSKKLTFFSSLLCPSRKDNSFCFFQFLYLLDNEKTRLYFLWNITTLVKKNMFELVVKHVWTCLNMLLLNILFTELVTNDVSPCRYYEKNHCISSFFITFNSKTRYKFKFHFSLSETKTHRAWIQNPTHFS